jgi:hypothetical protein
MAGLIDGLHPINLFLQVPEPYGGYTTFLTPNKKANSLHI